MSPRQMREGFENAIAIVVEVIVTVYAAWLVTSVSPLNIWLGAFTLIAWALSFYWCVRFLCVRGGWE